MNGALARFQPQAHILMRIAIGVLFWSNGAKKLFGWFGGMGPDGGSAELMSLMGLAGIIEFFGGLAVALGLFTQPVAFIAAGEMAVAYFYGHVFGPEGPKWFWWQNQGERSAMYAWIMLYLSTVGAGGFSLDAWRARNR
ncbi:MAG: DoxX family protein [Chloroflexi bacterium CFX6]|nr:DoxX family protein [Chloroflexi bacterium CFX6]